MNNQRRVKRPFDNYFVVTGWVIIGAGKKRDGEGVSRPKSKKEKNKTVKGLKLSM